MMYRSSALWVADSGVSVELIKRKRYVSPLWTSWAARAARSGYAGWEPDKHLDVVAHYGRWILFPRCWPGAPYVYEDRTAYPPGPGAAFLWTLRGYQEHALAAWLDAGCGVIQAPCGAGKTVIGAAAICRTNTPSLVLVHTLDLARQWMARLQECTEGATIGLIGQGEDNRDADIVIATFQTLTRWSFRELIEWGKGRGLVVVDECHHLPAVMMAGVMMGLIGRYRLGLTATPDRIDGLTGLIHDHLGPTVHAITAQTLQEQGATLRPLIEWVNTDWTADPDSEPHERKRSIAEDSARNAIIVRHAREAVALGRRVLILCDLRAHCHALADALTGAQLAAVAVTGSKTSKQRKEALTGMRSGDLDIMIATSLADEGLDIPELDCVILAAPCSNPARVEQRIGRALRPSEGKSRPWVIDIVDDWGPYRGYARRRARMYRDRGWL